MIRRFEVVPVPVVESMAESGELWQQMLRGTLPVFGVDDISPDHPYDLSPVVSLLQEHDVTVERTPPAELIANKPLTTADIEAHISAPEHFGEQSPDFDQDRYLHIDGDPAANGIDLSLHYTVTGRGVASFFDTTDEFAQDGYTFRRTDQRRATKLFLAGMVDDDQFEPKRHVIDCQPERLIVFRRGNRRPVGHIFQTTEFPRKYQLGWAGTPDIQRFSPTRLPTTQP